MSGGQSPSPAGHDGADGQAAPWPLWAAVSVQVLQTHSLLQSDQVPSQSVFGGQSSSPALHDGAGGQAAPVL